MTPVPNPRVLFNEIPTGLPVPGRTTIYDESNTIDLEAVELSTDSILVKVLYLSVDPYMRSRMREAHIPGYVPPFTLHEPINAHGVGIVLRSNNRCIQVGQHVRSYLDYAWYSTVQGGTHAMRTLVLLDNPEKLPWSLFIGILGVPGRTAMYGWEEFSDAKSGEVVFVTTGAGAVGSIVIQLAKRAGLKVIASAGSDAKVAYMKELGADVAFNYKTRSTADILKANGPIDIYWDNVGGESLDLALENAAEFGRFIECGMISGYNSDEPQPFKHLFNIIARNLKVFGFLTNPLEPKYGQKFDQLFPPLVVKGELKYKEDITGGLEQAGEAILSVFTGKNTGKCIIKVAEQ